MSKIVCFGEVLWDVFPNHKKIGGAPLNVATRLQSFKNDVAMISAIGNDSLGELILEYLKEHHINSSEIQVLDHFETGEVAIELMQKANFIKFNDEEIYEIAAFLNSPYKNLEQNIHFLSKETNTKHICVTKGEHGAVLLYDNKMFYNSGYQIKVADTVGSGDSFLATLISDLLQKENPQKAIDKACAVGALVAQKEGANPFISDKEILDFMKN